MRDWAALIVAVVFVGLGIWRYTARMDDCQHMGHGTMCCIFVWGR